MPATWAAVSSGPVKFNRDIRPIRSDTCFRFHGPDSHRTTHDFGYAAQDNPVSVHDFHATMLHVLGIDHKRLTVKFQGLDLRLTGISGDVVREILV